MKRRKTFNQINITPLTDIFLVLLIIMMVVAPMLDQQGLSLSVPTSTEQEQKQEEPDDKIVIVYVDEKGGYYVDEDENALDDKAMTELLKQKAKEKKEGLLIRANVEATHGAVVKLMDMARSAGILAISLVEG